MTDEKVDVAPPGAPPVKDTKPVDTEKCLSDFY